MRRVGVISVLIVIGGVATFAWSSRAQQPGPGTERSSDTAEELANNLLRAELDERSVAEAVQASLQKTQQNQDGKLTRREDLRAQLQSAVSAVFDARQRLERVQVEKFRSRVTGIEQALQARERLRGKIIERRTDELLDPVLREDADGAPSDRTEAVPGRTSSLILDSRTDPLGGVTLNPEDWAKILKVEAQLGLLNVKIAQRALDRAKVAAAKDAGTDREETAKRHVDERQDGLQREELLARRTFFLLQAMEKRANAADITSTDTAAGTPPQNRRGARIADVDLGTRRQVAASDVMLDELGLRAARRKLEQARRVAAAETDPAEREVRTLQIQAREDDVQRATLVLSRRKLILEALESQLRAAAQREKPASGISKSSGEGGNTGDGGGKP